MREKQLTTRERILQAAREEFAAKGPDGARVAEIADRARINKERLYAYIGSKDDLFQAVLKEAFADIARYDEALLELTEEDIPRLPEILLEHNANYLQQAPQFWRLLAWENLAGGQHAAGLPDFRQRGFGHLRKLYRQGCQDGIYRDDVSFDTFITVLTASCFFYESNCRTMSRSLGRKLETRGNRQRFLREAAELLGSVKDRKQPRA